MRSLITWAEEHRGLVLVLLFLFSLLVRFLTVEYLDLGGDNAEKWMQARRIAEGLGVTHWYNHSMRWAIVLPLAGLIKLFGPLPALSYVLPFTMSSMAAVFICLIGEKLHSMALGLTTSLLTILLPLMTVTGSQLWPGVFELGYISLMTWLVLVWIDTRSPWFLVLAGIAFFLGWGSRVTMLYSYPGMVLLIWFATKDFKAIVLYTVVAAGLCFVEWGWFWYDSGNPMGRLGLLEATRGHNPDLPTSLKHYLLNITNIKKLKGMLPVTILTIIAAGCALRAQDRRFRGIAAMYLIYMFLVFYMVSGISPLKFALPFGSRNWTEIAPYGLLLLVWYLLRLKSVRPKTGATLIAILFIAFTAFSIKKIPPTNSIIQMTRDYAVIAPALAANKPIRMVYEPWQPNFIEKILIETFTGQKKRKDRSDAAISLDMRRNQQRLASLFLPDISKFMEVGKAPLVPVEKHVYILPSTSGDTTPAAESVFGRKLHEARPLP